MNLSLSQTIASADGSVTRRLYLHTAIVAVFLLIVISITIWAGNTLTMITAIARFERTHTVSRVEAMVALLKYQDEKKPEELGKFQSKMAITQSYNKVFSQLLDIRKDTPDAEFVRILESTFSETDHETALIIVNRIKVLFWHPILKDLVADAVGANAAGEKIKIQVAHILGANDEVERAAIFAEIEKAEKEFIFCETSFSKSCSALSNQISSYVSYISIALLIISVGFTGLLTYLIGKSVIQQATRYTSDLEMEIQIRKQVEELLQHERDLSMDILNAQTAGIYRVRIFAPEAWKEDAWLSSRNTPYTMELITDSFCTILGTTKEAFANNPGLINDMVYVDDKEGFAKVHAEAMANPTKFSWQGRLLVNGKIRWVHFQSLPRPLENGDVLWTGTLIDIT